MGTSSSSLLDENRSNYIRGQAEAKLKNFSPHYRRQYLVTFFSQVQDEVEQHKMSQPHLLKQRDPPEESEALYKENVLYFDDTRKWKEKFVVVRGNYSLECHDSEETFTKGVPPRYKLQPVGGTVLTSEEKYMSMVDKAFPDPNSTKEEPGLALVTMPAPFPVYLYLPYCKHAYFCFNQEDRQAGFISILTDCIRHQNYDFLKKPMCEVQAFSKAVQLYRQEKGHYESWDMLIGNDMQVLANLVMEELVPTLQTEIVPRLRGKKMEKKRVWFATVEAAYVLVQDQLLEGLALLKEECCSNAKQQEAQIRENMDQIVNSRNFLAGKLQATVSENALKFCTENVQPYLASILEELMGPISLGFQEARLHCEREMERLCKELQEKGAPADLKGALDRLGRDGLQDCHQHLDVLSVQLQELRNRFKFSNVTRMVHCTLIDIQKLLENAAYTFELLLNTALKGNPANPSSDMEKVKHRVLKQYDYDSSTVRKRIFQEVLVDITLPAIQRNLAPMYKPELQKFEQYIFADCANFIQIENVYDDILLQILEGEISKVVKEAAKMKKHNLFMDSTDHPFVSQASLSDSRTPPTSSPASPAKKATSQEPAPALPPLGNGGPGSQQQNDTPASAREAGTETSGPAQHADGPRPEATAPADLEMERMASLSLNVAPDGTAANSMTEGQMITTTQQVVTDRAVYLRCPAEINEGHTKHLDCSAGIGDDTITTDHAEVKGDNSVLLSMTNGLRLDGALLTKDSTITASEPEMIESTTELLEPSSEQKDTCAEPQEGLEEIAIIHLKSSLEEESGTICPESSMEVKESGTFPVKTSTNLHSKEDGNRETAPPAVDPNEMVSGDTTEDVCESGVAPCIVTTGDSQETAMIPQDADAESSDASVTTDQGPVLEKPAVMSPLRPSEGQPAEGANIPSAADQEAGASPSDNSDPQEEEVPLGSVKEIRDLVVEVIEVEELVQRIPNNDQV